MYKFASKTRFVRKFWFAIVFPNHLFCVPVRVLCTDSRFKGCRRISLNFRSLYRCSSKMYWFETKWKNQIFWNCEKNGEPKVNKKIFCFLRHRTCSSNIHNCQPSHLHPPCLRNAWLCIKSWLSYCSILALPSSPLRGITEWNKAASTATKKISCLIEGVQIHDCFHKLFAIWRIQDGG